MKLSPLHRVPRLFGFLPGGPDPTISLTGQNPGGALGQTMDFTRATTKNYVSSAGVYSTIASGKPAIEVGKGQFLEAAHTNLAVRSEDFGSGSGPWVVLGNAANPVVANNVIAAPDGNLTGQKLTTQQATIAGGTYSQIRQQVTGATNGATYTFSVWLQAGTATSIALIINDGVAVTAFTTCNLTAAWQRFSVTQQVAATTIYPSIIWSQDTVPVASSGLFVYCWGMQLESGGFPHTYVTTLGATAAGNKDQASFPATGLPVAAGSIQFGFTPLWSTPNATATLVDTRQTDQTAGFGLYVDTARKLSWQAQNATALQSAALTWTPGTQYQIRAQWGAGKVYLFRNDVLVASDTSGSGTMPTAQTTLRLGDGYNSASPLDGYLSALSILAM